LADALTQVRRILYKQRELEREMLQRVRGLIIHEYYEYDVAVQDCEYWLRKRIKDV